MKKWKKYHSDVNNKKFDSIIIGSGIDHSPDRFRQGWLRPQSRTKNLYFVGQDITTVGVSSALFSGLLTASTVLGQNLSSLLKD